MINFNLLFTLFILILAITIFIENYKLRRKVILLDLINKKETELGYALSERNFTLTNQLRSELQELKSEYRGLN